jgi:hypothetical protein
MYVCKTYIHIYVHIYVEEPVNVEKAMYDDLCRTKQEEPNG